MSDKSLLSLRISTLRRWRASRVVVSLSGAFFCSFCALWGCSEDSPLKPYTSLPTERNMGGAPVSMGGASGGQGGAKDTQSDGFQDDGPLEGKQDERPSFGGAATGPTHAPPELPCESDQEWGEGQALSELNTDDEERLLGITPDAKTLVFQREDDLWVADRDSTSEPFSAPKRSAMGVDLELDRGVALHPNGLELVVVTSDGVFAQSDRKSRFKRFSASLDEAKFVVLNDLVSTAGVTLSSPAISASGSEFWWLEGSGTTRVWFAEWSTEILYRGEIVGCNALGCDELLDGTSRISSLSADSRTVFVQWPGQPLEMRHRSDSSAAFVHVVPLDVFENAHLTTECSRVYYDHEGDLLVAERL